MSVLDSHVHFWALSNPWYQWVLNQTQDLYLKRDYLPADLLSQAQHKLDGLIHIEAHDARIATWRETAWLNQILTPYKQMQFKNIAYVDLTENPEVFTANLIKLKNFTSVAGIRNILAYHPNFAYSPASYDVISHSDFLFTNLQNLKNMGFIFECQAYPYQIEKLLPMIEDLKLPTMIEHLALPAWHDHKQKWLWQSILNKIEQNPYVYIKLSAIDMFQPRENFSFILDQVFEKISNRCIYGSNYPVSFTQNYNYWFDYLNQYPFTQNERRQIFYGNAQKFYKMHD